MSSNNTSDFILLSNLIKKLDGETYYRTYAKTLLRTTHLENTLPPDSELITEMFRFFIQEKELTIYYENTAMPESYSEYKKDITTQDDWKKEAYVIAKDLMKLYANKCIVFPKSLLSDIDSA